MYSDFKTELGNITADFLEPIQNKYNEIIQDKSYLESVLAKGAENAFYRARKTLSKVYRKVGFIQPVR
jgi:tryptophanyl-tRNA synthetase